MKIWIKRSPRISRLSKIRAAGYATLRPRTSRARFGLTATTTGVSGVVLWQQQRGNRATARCNGGEEPDVDIGTVILGAGALPCWR